MTRSGTNSFGQFERIIGSHEDKLSAIDELRQLALDSAELGIWINDLEDDVTLWDERAREIFGVSPDEPITVEKGLGLIHPEDRALAERRVQEALDPGSSGLYEVEKRIIWDDGSIRWINTRGRTYFDNGRPVRMMGVVADVTERKKEQEKLGRLERDLLRVQEEERRRISQDLHDGVASHLTGVSLILSSYKQRADSGGIVTADELDQLHQMVKEGERQIRQLSRGLHPGELEQRTLDQALEERVEHVNLQVEGRCTYEGMVKLPPIDREVATHLYRIGQEGLTNAARHAGAQHIRVRLDREGSRLILTVEDDGEGFDPDQTSDGGLGRRSMKYRAQLVGGELEVETAPGAGTTVQCRIPLKRLTT